VELQKLLIRQIVKLEKRIRRLKKARKRLSAWKSRARLDRSKSKEVKNAIKNIDIRLIELRSLLFIWRCFGDGITAIYLSKYSLKHLYYDSDYSVKEDAGFLSDKTGFRKEYRLLICGIRMGVPVLLSDLTNIIRHGDICALHDEEPVLIEVKSSSNRNARTDRQFEQLKVLFDFYKNDGANNFRGVINTRRIALKELEITYERIINNVMHHAKENGFSSFEPEKGIRYIGYSPNWASSHCESLVTRVEKYMNSSTLVVSLTPDESWLPLYPFTLSMDAKNSVSFIQEELYLVVLIDMNVVKEIFSAIGIHAIVLMDGQHALQLCIDPNDLMKGVWRVSEQSFLRIACEFQSLEWFANEKLTLFDVDSMSVHVEDLSTEGYVTEIPTEWKNAKDFFDTHYS